MQHNDNNTHLQALKNIAQALVTERDWTQFHTPQNLSMNLSVEANELLEKFLWLSGQDSFDAIAENKKEIEDEVGDVLFSLLRFCSVANIDITHAFLQKIEKIKQKYPIEKAKGNNQKYTKF